MDFRTPADAPVLAWSMAWRSAALGVLVFAVLLAASRQNYATALVLLCLAILLTIELGRALGALDRDLAQFVDSLALEGAERPLGPRRFRRIGEALGRALDRAAAAREARQQQVDFLQALLDDVPAALIVLSARGEVVTANHAALALGVLPAVPLGAAPGIGAELAARLMVLSAGAREVMRVADGREVLVQAASFSAPAPGQLQLLALQSVAREFDAVELKAWTDLARVLAHEMMNSLTPVVSLSESLLQQVGPSAPEEIRGPLEIIGRRSAGLMAFVDRYRRVTDTPHPEKTRFVASDLVARVDRLLGPGIEAEGAAYKSCVANPELQLYADPDLLEQALINLLKNAAEAVSEGQEAEVSLTCELEADEVVITVRDNGPGLPPGDEEAAFVPFFTTKRNGSGIGLAISRRIAIAHGGRLEYSRSQPHGAIFRLVLPHDPMHAQPRSSHTAP